MNKTLIDKPKLKTVSIKLTERDYERLQFNANINGLTVEMLVKHLIECHLDGKKVGQF